MLAKSRGYVEKDAHLDVCDMSEAVVAAASFAGLRRGEVRGLEWLDYTCESLTVRRSIWKTFINGPKTRASAKAVPVIRQLAEILNAYRISMGNPATGVMFHSGDGNPMDLDKLARRVIYPLVRNIGFGMVWLAWVPAWHCVEFV